VAVHAELGHRTTYRIDRPVAFDEMVDDALVVRPAWREVGAVLDLLGDDGLANRQHTVRTLLEDDGARYRPQGSETDQPWALDAVPLLVEDQQWAGLERGLAQRADLLDLVLTDLYGPRSLLSNGLIPPEMVLGHAGFVRQVDQIRLPGPRQLFLAASDLARGVGGEWQVIADRTQAPSGAGYAMENRRVVSRAMPGLHRNTDVQLLAPFFHAMRLSLQQLSPTTHEVPRVVLLTPGVRSETAFDQAFLSSLLGFPLVEGADLTVVDGRVWQRSIGRLEPVDVVLRRLDSWFCDPLELRPDSQLGVPGLIEAARLGTVSVVNGIGSGVLENPALFSVYPQLCRALLGEELQLPSAQTWWCGHDASRHHVLANLDSLVIKPIARGVGRTSRFGWDLSLGEREEITRQIEAEPQAWVGQEMLALSTVPTIGAVGLEARPAVLRAFAVSEAGGYRVLPGGLVRVAPQPNSLIVSNADGAVSKDVWVLTAGRGRHNADWGPEDVASHPMSPAISPRVAEDLFWLGRYAERAENVARLLKIADNRWHDVHPDANPALSECVRILFTSLTAVTSTYPGFLGPDSSAMLASPRDELLSLMGETHRVGSLAHDIRRMHELADSVRDQLSGDTWTMLARLERGLLPFRVPVGRWNAADAVSVSLARLLESLMALSGMANESMVRDAGWHFMDAGRRLERCVQTANLISATLVTTNQPDVEDLVIESVLIAAQSIITHRRRYARTGVESLLELLLADRTNPRSLANQINRLHADLEQIPGGQPESIQRGVLGIQARVHELDAAQLAAADNGRRPALQLLTERVVAELYEVAMAVELAHFAQPAPLQSLDAFSTLMPS